MQTRGSTLSLRKTTPLWASGDADAHHDPDQSQPAPVLDIVLTLAQFRLNAFRRKLFECSKLAMTTTATITRITFDPNVMGGKACIRGLRMTAGTVLGLLAAGRKPSEIVDAYPYLEREDIDAVLAYAAWRLEEREVPLAGA